MGREGKMEEVCWGLSLRRSGGGPDATGTSGGKWKMQLRKAAGIARKKRTTNSVGREDQTSKPKWV